MLKRKCYVFDFAPNRALSLISEYSSRLDINGGNVEEKVADFLRFLFGWQNVRPGSQLHGQPGLARIIAQGAKLIVTCDTGIGANEAVEYARSRGVEMIITAAAPESAT